MNPPPPSPAAPKPPKGFAYYAVLGSQWAMALAGWMFMYQAVTVPHASALPVVGKPRLCLGLVVTGLALAILAVCYVKPQRPPRTRLWAIVSMAGHCLLLFLLTLGFFQGIKNRRNEQRIIAALKEESRQQEQTLARLYEERTNLIRTTADLREAATNLMSDLREQSNSRTGITNLNSQAMQQVREQLNKAGQQLSGDVGVMARIISINLDAKATRAQNLQACGQRVRDAHIEQGYGLATPGQIGDRRQLVYDFLAANRALAGSISNEESYIMTMLQGSNVSPNFIEIGRKQLSRSRPQRELMLQIRAYDQQQGEDLLGILDLLEKDWGKWHSDPTNKTVNFDNETSRLGYLQHRQAIHDASAAQISLQRRMLDQK